MSKMFSGAKKDMITGVKKCAISIQSGFGTESKGNAELGIAVLNEKSVAEAFAKVASTKPEGKNLVNNGSLMIRGNEAQSQTVKNTNAEQKQLLLPPTSTNSDSKQKSPTLPLRRIDLHLKKVDQTSLT